MTGPAGWTQAELDAIGGAEELDVATRRADGSFRPARIVWVVRRGDELFIRSVNGRDADWFRGAQTRRQGHVSAGGIDRDVDFVDADHNLDDDLDAAYRRKYGRFPGPTAHITAPAARDTTLRISPA